MDFFYENTEINIEALFDALMEFWDNDIPGINNREELAISNYVIQFGVPPNRIDLMNNNNIDGIKFKDAWEEKNTEYIIIEKIEFPYTTWA